MLYNLLIFQLKNKHHNVVYIEFQVVYIDKYFFAVYEIYNYNLLKLLFVYFNRESIYE
jgi:hypothetical protein